MSTPNMLLPVPSVGVTDGPDWASLLNSCMDIIDGHSHTSGSGVPITVEALDISSDLSLQENNLTDVRSSRYTVQDSPLSDPADLGCLYVSGSDLYFNRVNGEQIRITQAGGVTGTPGSIANLVSPASASYVAGNSTFVWQSTASLAANMDCGAVLLRNTSPNSTYAITLQPPTLSSNYTVTLPALPVVTSFMTITSGGVISTQAPTEVTPPGVILPYGGTSAPSGGWLLCDGTAVSRVTYSNLFAVIGTAFGSGNGSTTFNLPDLRGRFLRGVTGASSQDPDASSRTAMASGGNTGNNVGSVQGHAFQTHNHTDSGHTHSVDILTFNPNLEFINHVGAGGSNYASTSFNTSGSGTANIQNKAASGATSQASTSETRPVNAYVNYIIKT